MGWGSLGLDCGDGGKLAALGVGGGGRGVGVGGAVDPVDWFLLGV